MKTKKKKEFYMNRKKIISICLLTVMLFGLSVVGCKRRIEAGTSRSRTGEIKDYSARVTLVFRNDLVGPRHEANAKGWDSIGASIKYTLVINGKAVCQDSHLVFDGVESENFDLTPYIYKGENSANIGVGFDCGFPREKWAPYIGKTGMRLQLLNVQILRGSQVTYQQDVASIWNVSSFQGSNDLAEIHGEADQSTLSFTFYAE
jgi:hypothetical protein